MTSNGYVATVATVPAAAPPMKLIGSPAVDPGFARSHSLAASLNVFNTVNCIAVYGTHSSSAGTVPAHIARAPSSRSIVRVASANPRYFPLAPRSTCTCNRILITSNGATHTRAVAPASAPAVVVTHIAVGFSSSRASLARPGLGVVASRVVVAVVPLARRARASSLAPSRPRSRPAAPSARAARDIVAATVVAATVAATRARVARVVVVARRRFPPPWNLNPGAPSPSARRSARQRMRASRRRSRSTPRRRRARRADVSRDSRARARSRGRDAYDKL